MNPDDNPYASLYTSGFLAKAMAETLRKNPFEALVRRALAPRWPFGTIVRPAADPSDKRRLMVLTDNGNPSFTAVVLVSRSTREVGSIFPNYARARWEPES